MGERTGGWSLPVPSFNSVATLLGNELNEPFSMRTTSGFPSPFTSTVCGDTRGLGATVMLVRYPMASPEAAPKLPLPSLISRLAVPSVSLMVTISGCPVPCRSATVRSNAPGPTR